MKTISLSKFEIENFKGIKHGIYYFTDKTTVKGRNGVGKTTLYNAVLWCVFDKDINGNSSTDIRPHDENGVDIDGVDIVVSATFNVDGREITLKKTQRQKWFKKRGSEEKKFEGNENVFSVNDIPKSQKDYKTYIEENFCQEDVFLACSNAMSFFKLDTKKRRAKLMELAKEFTNADVIAADKEFEPLADMLVDGTVEELMTRSKGTIKRLNEQLKTIPSRIDEQEKSKVDIDLVELELAKNGIKEKISEIDGKLADILKQFEEYQKASDGILELKFAINDLKRKANEKLVEDKRTIEGDIFSLDSEIRDLQSKISKDEGYIYASETNRKAYKEQRQILADEWKRVNSLVFDGNSLVCSYCGQEYPQEKKEELRAEFEHKKAIDLKSIEKKGNELKRIIELQEEERENCKNRISTWKNEILSLNEQLENEKLELQKLPSEIDISDVEEYKALASKIEEKEKFLANGNSADAIRKELSFDKSNLEARLWAIEQDITKSQRNVDIDERISELQTELRATSQKIADEEKMLDLLERFNRKKMEMLTESVNKHFSMVKWKLFAEQLNGGYADCCKALVNGTDYEHGLNDSDCLLANIDILKTFQKMNDVSLPVFLDRAESIDADRIPNIDGQLICLGVSSDKELVVE